MVVQPGTRKDQQGTNKKAGNQRKKLHKKKNQTLGTFYQPLCIMEEEMGSQEREHKKEEEEERE